MVIRINDKNQNYNNVTKLLVKPKKIKIKDKNKEHYPYQTILKVYDIHCQNCVRTIENAFNSQEGFYAKVNTEDNTVTILSKQQHPTDELINTLSNVGYISKAI